MNRLILLPSIVILLAIFVEINAIPNPGHPSSSNARCTEWVWSACQNLTKGNCGRGTKKGTRTGECNVKEKTESCKVPCPGEKKVCKYRKGSFGDCDEVTLKRMRVDTLMTELSDSTCEPTKQTQKVCRKKCTFGPWTNGECKDGKMTITRTIKSGGEECQQKATKTKRCQSGGAGKRRGGGHKHRE